MRKINKYAQPPELKNWRQLAKQAGVNFTYEGLRDDAPVKKAVHTALLSEQGYLCAYTGIRIDEISSHLEHVKARTYCTADEKTDYQNLVACYPIGGECEFGAFKKDDWPDYGKPSEVRLFIGPLDNQCETSFDFDDNGYISSSAVNAGSSSVNDPAQKTIEKLALDHKELNTRRKQAITGAIRPLGKPLTAEQAQVILAKIEQPKNGRLREFCFVIEQALERHLQSLIK
ncbi:MAG: TIGR02646 family protein [Bacteroidota bacterium]|nr:TIGR02646 family protein [Bacteroidota bacterium]